jgi:hypothetical protein
MATNTATLIPTMIRVIEKGWLARTGGEVEISLEGTIWAAARARQSRHRGLSSAVENDDNSRPQLTHVAIEDSSIS